MHKILVYLHIIHLLKSSTCFEHYSAHLQEVYVVIVYICSLWYRHSVKRESSKRDTQFNHIRRILSEIISLSIFTYKQRSKL